jgi:hypothetical protein
MLGLRRIPACRRALEQIARLGTNVSRENLDRCPGGDGCRGRWADGKVAPAV